MKTWEMIKNLTEDNAKKFQCIGNSGNPCFAYIAKETDLYDNVIVMKSSDGRIQELVINDYTSGYDWEEVIEPVDCQTAYNDCLENGTNYRYTDKYNNVSLFKTDGLVRVEDHNGHCSIVLNRGWIKEV